MPTTFNSYFGTNLHGAVVTWNNTPGAVTSAVLRFEIDLHWYDEKFGTHLGYTGSEGEFYEDPTFLWSATDETIKSHLQVYMSVADPFYTVVEDVNYDGFMCRLEVQTTYSSPRTMRIIYIANASSFVNDGPVTTEDFTWVDMAAEADEKSFVDYDSVVANQLGYAASSEDWVQDSTVTNAVNYDLCTEKWQHDNGDVSCVRAKLNG